MTNIYVKGRNYGFCLIAFLGLASLVLAGGSLDQGKCTDIPLPNPNPAFTRGHCAYGSRCDVTLEHYQLSDCEYDPESQPCFIRINSIPAYRRTSTTYFYTTRTCDAGTIEDSISTNTSEAPPTGVSCR